MIDNTYNHVFACSVVLFTCKGTLLCAANADQPPKINEITNSVVVQPSEQIVIRAEVTLSGTPSVFVSWHHGNNNNTYEDHIIEDPICDEAREVRLYFMYIPC